MKIGSFAKEFGVSIDTIRYYIELGLLIPEKEAHYRMTDTCISDMQFICELKNYDFSLSEILKILSLKRLAIISDSEEGEYFEKVLLNKKNELLLKRERIEKAIYSIESKINNHPDQATKTMSRGISLHFLSMLNCPYCQTSFDMSDVTMYGHELYHGKIFCDCGYQALINEGILQTNDIRTSKSKYSIYDIDIKKWNPDFVSLLEKGKLWISKQLRNYSMKNKLFIETNLEVSMMLPKYLSMMPKDAYYIFTCHSLDMIKKLKSSIEKSHPNVKALYIVNSDMLLPIKHRSIDYYVDSTSFTQYSLVYDNSPLKVLKPYLKDTSTLFGYYLHYDSNAQSLRNVRSLYQNIHPNTFHLSYLTTCIDEIGLSMAKNEKMGFEVKPGDYFSYHEEGEKLNLIAYTANQGEFGTTPSEAEKDVSVH